MADYNLPGSIPISKKAGAGISSLLGTFLGGLIGGPLGAAVGAAFGIGSAALTDLHEQEQISKEEQRYREAFDYQKELNNQAFDLAERNFSLQNEQYNYEKQLQQTIFHREDSAIQRQARDLEAAGLSKTLAAGSGANAGAVVSTQAPQINYNPNEIGVFTALVDAINQSRQTSSLLALQNAQAKLFDAQASQVTLDTNLNSQFSKDERVADIAKTVAETSEIKEAKIPKAKEEILSLAVSRALANANISKVNAEVDKIYSDIGINDENKKLIQNQVANLIAERVNIRLLTKENKIRLELLAQEKLLNGIQIAKGYLDLDITQWNSDYYKTFGTSVDLSGSPLTNSKGYKLGIGKFGFSSNSKLPYTLDDSYTKLGNFLSIKFLDDIQLKLNDSNLSVVQKNAEVYRMINEYIQDVYPDLKR